LFEALVQGTPDFETVRPFRESEPAKQAKGCEGYPPIFTCLGAQRLLKTREQLPVKYMRKNITRPPSFLGGRFVRGFYFA
jgi:hypothetical protein